MSGHASKSRSLALDVTVAAVGLAIILLVLLDNFATPLTALLLRILPPFDFSPVREVLSVPVNLLFHLAHSLYQSVQIMGFHWHPSGEPSEEPSLAIKLAVILAMVETVVGVFWAVRNIFPEQARELWSHFSRNHVVVCGLNRRALHLVRSARQDGLPVIVIEKSGENPLIEAARKEEAVVIVGDAAHTEVLKRARVEHSSHLIALGSNDGANVDIALAASEVALTRRGPPLKCMIHIFDYPLLTVLRRSKLLEAGLAHIEVRAFDSYEICVRGLLSKLPLDRGGICSETDPRRVHLIVIGFGLMGEALVVQAAREAHYVNQLRTRITVIDRNALHRRNEFFNRYPHFGQIFRHRFIAADATDQHVLAAIQRWCARTDAITTVAVCFDDDARSLSYALSLRRITEAHGVPIRVRMPSAAGLTRLLHSDERRRTKQDHLVPSAELFTPFGMMDECCDAQTVLHDKTVQLAREIHEAFRALEREKGIAERPATLPWNRLAPDFQDSNIQQFMHIPVKLRAIHCFALPGSKPPPAGSLPFDKFSDAEILMLAKVEHLRFNAERFLAGWKYGPERNPEKKLSPYLVPWEKVPPDVQQYDVDVIKRIPALLKHAGYTIYRTPL